MKYLIFCVAVFIVAYWFFKNQERIKMAAAGVAIDVALDSVKSDINTTKAWSNQVWNTWKQIWS